LRISGFFRDAFPDQIALFDKAVRAVGALDEDEGDNPVAARMRAESGAAGGNGEDAERRRGGPDTGCSARSPAPTARGCRR
jgi:cobaltochelatase CobN